MQKNALPKPLHLVSFLFLFLIFPALARSEAIAPTGFYDFAVFAMDQDEKELYEMAIEEFNRYIDLFPEDRYVDDCLFRIAKLHERSGKYHKAVLCHMKLIYMYPTSLRKKQSYTDILQLISKGEFKRVRGSIEELSNYEAGERELEARSYDFIQALWKINDPDMYRESIAEFNRFLYKYTNHPDAPSVQRWIAEFYVKSDEPKPAIAGLERIFYLFKERGDLPGTRMRIAEIYLRELRDVYLAKKNYLLVTREYAEDRQASLALLNLARIEAEKSKPRRPDKALDYLEKLIKEYPASPEAPQAYMLSAELFVDQYNDIEKAVNRYLEVEARYPKSEQAPPSLSRAGELYYVKQGNPAKAAEIFIKMARAYPEFLESAQRLFEAAEIEETVSKNIPGALSLYKEVVEKFPESSYAKKARGKLKKYGQT
jgi:TolA-binding protein